MVRRDMELFFAVVQSGGGEFCVNSHSTPVGLSIATSYMPSKPADFGFFNVLSIERQGEPDPVHIRDSCGSVRVSSFGGASWEERQLRVGVSPQLAVRISTSQQLRWMHVWCLNENAVSPCQRQPIGRRCAGRVASSSCTWAPSQLHSL